MTRFLTFGIIVVAATSTAVAGPSGSGSIAAVVSAATGIVALLAAVIWVPASRAMRQRRKEIDDALLRIETSVAVIQSVLEDLRRMQAIHEKRLDTISSVLWRGREQ